MENVSDASDGSACNGGGGGGGGAVDGDVDAAGADEPVCVDAAGCVEATGCGDAAVSVDAASCVDAAGVDEAGVDADGVGGGAGAADCCLSNGAESHKLFIRGSDIGIGVATGMWTRDA